MKQRIKVTDILYPLIGLIDIGYTIWLAHFMSLTTRNLSTVGYWLNKRTELIIWGLLTGGYFIAYLLFLLHKVKCPYKSARIIAVLAGSALMTGIFIPYQPWNYPVLSNVHIACSLVAPFTLVAAICQLFHFINQVYGKHAELWIIIGVAMAGAAGIFIKYTIITSALEIYVVSCLVILLWNAQRISIININNKSQENTANLE